MTVRVLAYGGDGSYYLRDPAHELDGLRRGPAAGVLRGERSVPVTSLLETLLADPPASGRRALDVIVAAPKPLSLLLAIEPQAAASRVVSLHARAVASAVDYLADVGFRARGRRATPIVVAFTHGVNRLLDPHLHSHVLVGARDGRGVPIDAREVRRHAAAADALYLATLRDGLPEAVGRTSWVNGRGEVRVEGVDHGLVAAMSVPRGRDGRLERSGAKLHPSAAEARCRWSATIERAVDLGVATVPDRDASTIDEHLFARSLGDGLVSAVDVVRAWATACTFGERADRARAAAALAAPELAAGERRPAVMLREAGAVRLLGPRPRDPSALAAWQEGRALVATFLREGNPVGAAERFCSPSPATLLAVARLDIELARRGHVMPPQRDGREAVGISVG
jgi:hypothetical protein